MSKLETHFDNRDKFQDITTMQDPVTFQEERVAGHRFRHVLLGLYKAEPPFAVSREELGEIMRQYKGIRLLYPEDPKGESDIRTIHYGYSASMGLDERCLSNVINHPSAYLENGYGEWMDLLDWKALLRMYDQDGEEFLYRHGVEDGLNQPIFNTVIGVSDITPDMLAQKPRAIRLQGCIGYLVEEGIYYFGVPVGLSGICSSNLLPHISLIQDFSVDMAVIGHTRDFHPTIYLQVEYVTFEKKYYDRLHELMCEVSEYDSDTYYSECQAKKDDREAQSVESTERPRRREEIKEEKDNLAIEEGAEELVQGMGFRNLDVMYKMIYEDKHKMEAYEAAYKLGEELLLVKANERESEIRKERHNLKLVQKLYVKQVRKLNNGLEYPVIHKVIDCAEDKWKELLTPEAWELFAQSHALHS